MRLCNNAACRCGGDGKGVDTLKHESGQVVEGGGRGCSSQRRSKEGCSWKRRQWSGQGVREGSKLGEGSEGLLCEAQGTKEENLWLVMMHGGRGSGDEGLFKPEALQGRLQLEEKAVEWTECTYKAQEDQSQGYDIKLCTSIYASISTETTQP